MSAYQWSTGANTPCITVNTAGTYSVTITNSNGCTSSCSRTLTVSPGGGVSCSITPPAIPPVCGTTGNPLTANIIGGNSLLWSVSSSNNSWAITGGQGTPSITYTCGSAGINGLFTLVVTNTSTGCTSVCTINIVSTCTEYCSYTQAFYGSTLELSCNGYNALSLINQALTGGPFVLGIGPRTLTVLTTEGTCLNSKMPAPNNGNVGQLPVGNVTCATATGSAYLSGPKLKNKLLTQTIALTMNVRLNPALGNLQLTAPYMITYAATSCSSGIAIPSTQAVFNIPQQVLNCLGTSNTVNNLLTLANQALGNVLPLSCTSNLQNIHDAVMAINLGFDHCRILGGFTTTIQGSRNREENYDIQENNLIGFNSYPNPFDESATIEFSAYENAHARLEVYNLIGQDVNVLFDGEVKALEKYSVRFDSSKLAEGMYICKLTIGSQVFYHKMMLNR
jgi:hypothetical protein